MDTRKRKVCVGVIDRANLGRLLPLIRAIRDSGELELQLLCGGSFVLPRFGNPAAVLEADGFRIDGRVFAEIEGGSTETMARSTGLHTVMFSSELARLRPDVVLLIGDRYEAMSLAIASTFMNIATCHAQGGEISGSIDESIRHSITKLCHYHIPATQRAAEYLVRMGERRDSILCTGCPGSDITPIPPASREPYLMVVYHPETTRPDRAREEMAEVIRGVEAHSESHHVRLWWPNADPGSDSISKVIRQQVRPNSGWDTIKNLSPEEYAGLLQNAACCVGNSSSFVRDSARFGTPVVLVGSRQDGRECGPNVVRVAPHWEDIAEAIKRQLAHGRWESSDLYGKPGVSQRIVDALVGLRPVVEKRLAYSC